MKVRWIISMELIEIVDSNGHATGEIIDKDLAHDKNLLHNEICCFILNDKHQVLLQKRATTKRTHPDKWGLCAGHVSAYESLLSAALREMKEELGLDVSIDELHAFSEKFINIDTNNSQINYFYYVKSNLDASDFVIQTEELSEVKWFDIDTIVRMIKNNDDSMVFSYESDAFKKKWLELFEDLKKTKWEKEN